MRKGLIYLSVFLLLLVIPSGVRFLRYYNLGGVERIQPPPYAAENVPQVPTPAMAAFVDEPQTGKGLVLLDEAHENSFTADEISYLDGRLSARGFELLPYSGGELATALRPASAFVVITPLRPFNREEIQAVSDFVARGGRLLLIGDPTRFNLIVEEDLFSFSFTFETDRLPLNSLANEFDIIYNDDYLYNTVENEGNFRNIILKETGFADTALVTDLEQLVFYGSHSLQVGPTGSVLLAADDNTWSSATDRPGDLALAATSREGQVLALGDVHFLFAPYYTVFDNSRFIAQIADFLTEPRSRHFVLADFPYFFGGPVNLVYMGAPDLGPDAFDEIIALQEAFRQAGQELTLAATPDPDGDTLYLGLYNQSEEVAELLASADIALTIDPPVLVTEVISPGPGETAGVADEEAPPQEAEVEAAETAPAENETDEADMTRLIESSLGNVQMSGTAIILLDEQNGRRSVVVLAASGDGLENTVNRLLDLIPFDATAALAGCLLQDDLALCPTSVGNEVVEAELESGGTPDTAEAPAEEAPAEEAPAEEAAIPLDATDQGPIEIGESVTGMLAEDEKHAWTFSGGPATIDITVESGDDLDSVLELYNPDNELIDSSDANFTGENEELAGVEIADDSDYTIVVRDFFNDGGAYTLTVSAGEPGEESDNQGILIFADDDGVPLTSGFTSAEAMAALLGTEYEVTIWVSTEDGPLQEDTLAGYELLVWDSGDYRTEAGLLDEDTAIILDYLERGGDVFITGVAPPLLGDLQLAPLSDLEIAGDDPVLLDGLVAGEIVELDQSYDAVLSELLSENTEEGSVAFFLRGPNSEGSGYVVGLAAGENEFHNQKTVILLAPFVGLPADIQETLLGNIVMWFGL